MNCSGCKHLIKSVDVFKSDMRCMRLGLDNVQRVKWHEGCEFYALEKAEKVDEIKEDADGNVFLF